MHRVCLFFIGALLAGCVHVSGEKTLTLVDTGAVDAGMLEQIRSFAQRELRVPVRITKETQLAAIDNFQSLEKAAQKKKQACDAAYIVVANLSQDSHLEVFAESGIAIVNAQPLAAGAAGDLYKKRVQRMVMRAAAFVFGLEPTPDPYCVTRDYRSLEDLDRMGNNYSPPWQARYAREAEKRGLVPAVSEAPFPKAR